MVKLETCNLSDNLLQSIPPSIIQLNSLKTINLSGNFLTQLPRELCQIAKLDHLDISLRLEHTYSSPNCLSSSSYFNINGNLLTY